LKGTLGALNVLRGTLETLGACARDVLKGTHGALSVLKGTHRTPTALGPGCRDQHQHDLAVALGHEWDFRSE
jgi:hypothetical protein